VAVASPSPSAPHWGVLSVISDDAAFNSRNTSMQILDRCTVDRDKVATTAAAGAAEDGDEDEEVKDEVEEEDGTVAGSVSSARASANSSFRLSSDAALAGLL
jgi:hypothetical protein